MTATLRPDIPQEFDEELAERIAPNTDPSAGFERVDRVMKILAAAQARREARNARRAKQHFGKPFVLDLRKVENDEV